MEVKKNEVAEMSGDCGCGVDTTPGHGWGGSRLGSSCGIRSCDWKAGNGRWTVWTDTQGS